MAGMSPKLPSGQHLLNLLGKLAGAAGLLTFLCSVAGAAKLFVMYRWLDCVWVFKLHGFNDFVFEGVGAVAAFTCAAAIAYCITESHKKILITLSNWLSVLLWLGLFILMWIGVSRQVYIYYVYHYFFAAAGVSFAGQLVWSMGRRDAFVCALISIVGFALGSILSAAMSYYWFDNFNESEMVVFADQKSNSRGALVNSFSGKHLLRVCGPDLRFMVVDPSEGWISEPKGSKSCFGI